MAHCAARICVGSKARIFSRECSALLYMVNTTVPLPTGFEPEELTLHNSLVRWPCSLAEVTKKGYVYVLPLLPHESIKAIQSQEKALKLAVKEQEGQSVPIFSVLQISASGEDLVVLKFHLDAATLAELQESGWDASGRYTVRVQLCGTSLRSTKRSARSSIWRVKLEPACCTEADRDAIDRASDLSGEAAPNCGDVPSSSAHSDDDAAEVPPDALVDDCGADTVVVVPVVDAVAVPVVDAVAVATDAVPEAADTVPAGETTLSFEELVQAERDKLRAHLSDVEKRCQHLDQALEDILTFVTEDSANLAEADSLLDEYRVTRAALGFV